MADILAGMEKPRFRLGLVYRLTALGLSPGDGEARVLFYEFRYCKMKRGTYVYEWY